MTVSRVINASVENEAYCLGCALAFVYGYFLSGTLQLGN